MCVEQLERRQSSVIPGYESIAFNNVKENDKIRFNNELGQTIYGVVSQLHPQWAVDKTHIVITKTTMKWEPDLQAKKLYVGKDTIKGLLRLRVDSSLTPASPCVQGVFEEVQWRDLHPGDKIHVQYVSLKDPSLVNTVFGIFKSAPTYSDVIEFVKTDTSFLPVTRSVTVIPLAGSMCKFHRLCANVNKKRKM